MNWFAGWRARRTAERIVYLETEADELERIVANVKQAPVYLLTQIARNRANAAALSRRLAPPEGR